MICFRFKQINKESIFCEEVYKELLKTQSPERQLNVDQVTNKISNLLKLYIGRDEYILKWMNENTSNFVGIVNQYAK